MRHLIDQLLGFARPVINTWVPRLPVRALERADRAGSHVPAVVPSVTENDIAFDLRVFQRDSPCFTGQKRCCLESSPQQLILKRLGHFLLLVNTVRG